MGAYRTIIGCNLQQFETGSFEPTRYLILDTQDEKSVTANAVIAQQPYKTVILCQIICIENLLSLPLADPLL